MNCGKDPGNAKRVRHRVLVSKKGVAAARRRLEPGECVVRHAHEACVREWCSCAEGMRAECPLAGGRRKTDHKGWRGAEITRRGARFGTAAVGGGLGY